MTERTLKRMALALAVLVVGYLLVFTFSGRRSGGGAPVSELAGVLDDVQADRVTSVRIEGPETSLALGRAETGGTASEGDDGSARWTVNGLATDSAAVARFWTAVDESEVGSTVSTNPGNHGRLGVTDSAAIRVTFERDGGEPVTILLGGSGPQFPSAYARAPGDDVVAILSGDLRASAARPLDQWRDKRVVRVDTSAVATLVSRNADGEVTAVRTEGAWTLGGPGGAGGGSGAGGGAPDSTAMREWTAELSNVVATGFAPDTATWDEAIVRRVWALDAEGDTLVALEAAEGPTQYRIRRIGDDTLFELATWRGERLFPTRERVVGG